MTEHIIPDLDTAGLRKFGLTTGIALCLIFGLLLPWLFSFSYPIWPWFIAAVLIVWALAAPDTLRPVYSAWMKFALILNKFTTPIILGIIFFLVFLPAGLIMRTFRGDPMRRAMEPDAKTYRVESNSSPVDNMEKPY